MTDRFRTLLSRFGRPEERTAHEEAACRAPRQFGRQLGTADVVICVLVVINLAVAQPMLDLLGRHPIFFVAHAADPVHIASMALLFTSVVPMVLAGVILLGGRLHPMSTGVGFILVIAAATAMFGSRLLRGLPESTAQASMTILGVLVVGVVLAWGLQRSQTGRTAMRLGLVAPPLLVLHFLVFAPVSDLVRPGEADVSTAVRVAEPPPIVMVVLDELPVISLMDGESELNAGLFPNFARLAADGTWFRNASTSHGRTADALPALLTGRFPEAGHLPVAADHPDNLFTLMSSAYRIHASEEITDLCAVPDCHGVADAGRYLDRMSTLLADVRVLALHAFLPQPLTDDLPAVDQAWAGFGPDGHTPTNGFDGIKNRARRAVDADRRQAFSDFVAGIPDNDEPLLVFAHVMLPHRPWQYLPDATEYSAVAVPGTANDVWGRNEWLIRHAQQRHLLQLGLTDRLLGELWQALDELGIYDESLVIVTADHGIAFESGKDIRELAVDTFGHIAAVPLIVKRPHEQRGSVNDAYVELVDVLPTVFDVLEIDPLPGFDGQSVYSDALPPKDDVTLFTSNGRVQLSSGATMRTEALNEKVDVFDPALGWEGIYHFGPHRDLVGTRTRDLSILAQTAGTVTFDHVVGSSPTSPPPARVTGEIELAEPLTNPEIAVSVDGVVGGVGEVFSRGGRVHFAAMVSADVRAYGESSVELYRVLDEGGGIILRPFEERPLRGAEEG